MISFEEALSRVQAVAKPLGEEKIAFEWAEGRVLAAPVSARFAMPRSDVSAMDGYALGEDDLSEAPFSLTVSGESAAGSAPGQKLLPGTAFRIFTGAPIPEGATCVIVQENTERDGDTLRIVRPFGPGRHIRKAGSDFRAGDVLVPAGRVLDWKTLTAAAAGDRGEVTVFRQPRVVILATGDELAAPGQAEARPGAIPESVSFGIAAFVSGAGGQVLRRERLPDDPDTLAAAAAKALVDADIIVMIGGASVGDRDFSRSVFGADPDYIFPKVAIKPGKPVWLANVAGKFVMGLPGNPTSALVTARLFLKPLLDGLGGREPKDSVVFERCRLAADLAETGGRETFVRAAITAEGARPLTSQDSSSQSALSLAELLIRRSAHAPAAKVGEVVEALRF